jgi:hypothetical protein
VKDMMKTTKYTILILGILLLTGCGALESIAEWNLDLAVPYNHVKNWISYHLENNGVWGYLLIGATFIVLGYSSDITRPTVSLVVSGAIKGLSAFVFIGIGATLFKTLGFMGKIILTQVQRVWKGIF